MDRLEQALRDVLTGARTELEATPEAVAAVHTGVRRRRRRRHAMTAVAGVALLAVAGAGGTALVSRQHHAGHASVATGPRWALGAPVTLPAQAGAVTSMSAYGGVLWLSTSTRQLLRVEESTGTVRGVDAGGAALAVAYAPRHVWVALTDCRLRQLAPATGAVERTYTLPCDRSGAPQVTVEATGDLAWAALSTTGSGRTHLSRVDARSHRVTVSRVVAGEASGGRPMTLAGAAVVTATHGSGGLTLGEYDATRLRPVTHSTMPVSAGVTLAYSDRLFVSVAHPTQGEVFAVDLPALGRHDVRRGAALDVTTGNGIAWLLLAHNGRVHLQGVGATSLKVLTDLSVPGAGAGVIADGGQVWVLVPGAGGTGARLLPVLRS